MIDKEKLRERTIRAGGIASESWAGSTHWSGCWQDHRECLAAMYERDVEALLDYIDELEESQN